MALKYGFYDSVDGDRVYAARDFTAIFNNLILDGVLPQSGSRNQFVATPVSNELGVTIGTGWAWFDSTYTYLTAAQAYSLDAADAVLYRWDAIVIETDAENRKNYIKVIKGTPAAEAAYAKPALSANQHPLCYVKVRPGATQLVQSDIENRVGLSDCPFITGVVGTADLTQMFAAWQYDFEEWFAALSDTLSGDVAANLYVLIQQNASDISALQTALADKADASDVAALIADVGSGGKNCRLAFGSYVGDGSFTFSHVLTVDFYPVAAIIVEEGATNGSAEKAIIRPIARNHSAIIEWSDNSVTISGTTQGQRSEYNSGTYYWVVIGYTPQE